MFALGQPLSPTEFFVIADKAVVPGGTTLVQAADRLFKAHYVFNVEYAPPLQQFWEFVAAVVYEVLPLSAAKPNVRSLATSVKSISI